MKRLRTAALALTLGALALTGCTTGSTDSKDDEARRPRRPMPARSP